MMIAVPFLFRTELFYRFNRFNWLELISRVEGLCKVAISVTTLC